MKIGLRTSHLSYARSQQTLFHNLSFELHPGQGLFIHGPNGSGKTSLLRVLAGLMQPSEGNIYWGNQALQEVKPAYHDALHFLGHLSSVKGRLTIKENLRYSQSLADHPHSEEKLEEALQKVDLLSQQNQFAQQLSAGQKRRLALARLLAFPKPLWILDEPFTNLDEACQRWFCNALEEQLQKGGLVILASHQPLPLKIKPDFQTLGLPLDDGALAHHA